MVLDEPRYACVLEGNGGIHLVAAIEAEGTHEPFVGATVVASCHHVLSHGMLTARLGEGEVGQWREVVVECHVVIEILIAGDARERPVVEVLSDGQSVHDAGAAIKAGVVVGYLPGLDPLVGVTALTAD